MLGETLVYTTHAGGNTGIYSTHGETLVYTAHTGGNTDIYNTVGKKLIYTVGPFILQII